MFFPEDFQNLAIVNISLNKNSMVRAKIIQYKNLKSNQSMFWKSLRKINSKTLFILLFTPNLPTRNHYVSITVNILARSNQYLSWDTSGRRDLWRHMAHSRKVDMTAIMTKVFGLPGAWFIFWFVSDHRQQLHFSYFYYLRIFEDKCTPGRRN